MARWSRRPRPAVTAWLLAWLLAALALPAAAQAHGAVDPAASSYLARVGQVPEGTDAKVVDGDLRLWLKASPRTSVVVLDYRGAPYLRFTRAGVFVNRASSMWYLNQVPVQTPPIGLTARTTPRWQRASGGHSYEWHDGRLHALASAPRPAGATYIGRWNVPLRRQLHGRPGISAGQWIVLALALVFAGWAATRLARGSHGWFVLFLIAAAAIWEGATLVGALLYGFVLLALPAFPARLAVVACLATGVALLPVVFALAERPQRQRRVVAGAATES
jgi:hypothetical protein